jgi:hypothetical protein
MCYNVVIFEKEIKMEKSDEENLSIKQLAQIDTVNYAAYKAVCEILNVDPEDEDNGIPWDIEWIGELSDILKYSI